MLKELPDTSWGVVPSPNNTTIQDWSLRYQADVRLAELRGLGSGWRTLIFIDATIQAVQERAQARLSSLSQDLEPGEVPPSEAAKRVCVSMLTGAAAGMPPGQRFPFPHLDTAGRGDISCEWRSPGRTVVALVAPRGLAAIHEMRLKDGRVVSRRTTAYATADELRDAIVRYLSAVAAS